MKKGLVSFLHHLFLSISSNIGIFIMLSFAVLSAEIMIRAYLNLNSLDWQAYLLNFYYCILLFLFIIPFRTLKNKLSILNFLVFCFCLYNFVTLMNLQNGIFLALLKNDIFKLSVQLFLCFIPFSAVLFISVLVIKWKNPVNDSLLSAGMLMIILFLGARSIPNVVYQRLAQDYSKQPSNMHPAIIYLDRSHLDTETVFEKLGLLQAYAVEAKNELTIAKVHIISDDDYNLAVEFLDRNKADSSTNSMSGTLEGMNLIMILCESLDDSAIDPELTPALYYLRNEGISFNNHYAPLYPNHTADSEFISQTSMLPSINYGSTYKNFAENAYPYALANLFKAQGYQTNAFHSYFESFYNRDEMLTSLGFNQFIGADYLEIGNAAGTLSGYQGFYSDSKMIEHMFEYTDTSKPFYNLFLSLSGHSAYIENRKDIQENLAIINAHPRYKDYPVEAKCYLASQMLLDQSIELLMAKLSEKDLLDNTAICLFSDHYPYGISNDKAIGKIIDNSTEFSKYRVPFIIYHPNIPAREINSVTSTFDIYPTLTNLFDLDITNAYTVGNDAFSKEERYVLFKNGNILTDEYYYNCQTGKNTLLSEKITLDYDAIFSTSRDVLNHAQNVIRADLYCENSGLFD